MPVYVGRVVVGQVVHEARFIPGQPLMGVEFMQAAFSSLHVDFRSGHVTLR